MSRSRRSAPTRALAVLAIVVAGLASVSCAHAAARTAAWWQLEASAAPTNLPPGGEGDIIVTATNIGDAPIEGATQPVRIAYSLPPALRASVAKISALVTGREALKTERTVTCLPISLQPPTSLQCSFGGALEPYESLQITLSIKQVAPTTSSGEGEVSIIGGGAPPASLRRPLTVSSAPTPFGVEGYSLRPEGEDGALDTQAGSHPFQLTTALALNRTTELNKIVGRVPELLPQAPALAKDLRFKWPGGLIGNPTALPRCTAVQFAYGTTGGAGVRCPADTIVGVALVTFNEPIRAPGLLEEVTSVYNLEPAAGEPARFGFSVARGAVVIDTAIRTGGDYGVTVSVDDVTQVAGLLSSVVTIWGTPGDPRHDQDRGEACLVQGVGSTGCVPLGQSAPPPFLTLPTFCAGTPQTSLEADSWNEPANALSVPSSEPMQSLTGCADLPFSPEIDVKPDEQQASRPSGLTADVRVPQQGWSSQAEAVGSDVKNIAVTLPEGVTLNPAGADGLQACSQAQVGYLPSESSPAGELRFTPKLPDPLEQGVNFCPDASKIGTAKITTPLLANPLVGAVYLAAQDENPFGSLVAMYIVAEDPVSGSLVKLPGQVALNQQTGQIVATFENTPQLAFEEAELHFFGGEDAPLSTPAHCGTYTTDASFIPWSGTATVSSQSSFAITAGLGGGPCPGVSLPFAPSLQAGTTNIQAGAFSSLSTTIGREDGQQSLQAVSLKLPAGLSGMLAGVKLCGEAQANAGTCGPESLIGSTVVSVGVGKDPYSVTGGRVYLTEKYAGAPFGLSIVSAAVAGPFNLGQVIVRAKVEVDPHTAALTVTTGAIPHILDGIPLQIKRVNVTIERSGFTFNPTNCNKLAIAGTIDSVEGDFTPVSVPFQVTNCANLKFAPKFAVSTSGRDSKAQGASLTAKLSYPAAAPQGTQADIAKVKVDLPKQLPSRLTTLQKACTNVQFEANPAGCPAASKIGYATVTTPLLPVPLTGPAIFVSHGGEAFPSLTMVLQGYGVTIDLVGMTFISKAGITSTTFKTVPDVPFDSFELTLPQGRYSALTANLPTKANYHMCGRKLAMPTAFVAQNGAEIHESTPISVTGCAKAKPLTRAQKVKAALKVCRKRKKSKRTGCEKAARKRYGPVNKRKGKRR